MTTTPDDQSPAHGAPAVPVEEHSGLRRVWEGIKEFVGEAVGEVILQVLSCLLLAGAALGAHWSWSRSPGLTLGAAAVLVIGTVAAVTAWRHPGPLRARRMGATLLTVLLALALWFILYGSKCGCI
ncbi:lysine transporter LysE [Streptomyces sp. NPDC059443]|uniref:lysine transporter LysE n=1 Tax=unclassified Streptomyces TaxID=2593676 RepID=UPI0036C29700